MAHVLKEKSRPKVHQALHGYADGHRQLALSVPLKARDQKTLLALSDISGPAAQLSDEGYLTGYPLPESGFYALARTWPAAEMLRPGCVWTHTLLVDFDDLAALESLSGLERLFDRPRDLWSFEEYAQPKWLQPAAHSGLPHVDEQWTASVLAAIYGRPKNRIVATRVCENADSAMLAIWSQQWPRLRRSFRFCTLAASDRSTDGMSFDLQLLSNVDRSVRSRFSGVVDADKVSADGIVWLEDALQDLSVPDVHGLRSFFRTIGSEVAGGREAFRPLCRLHRAMRLAPITATALSDAVSVLTNELQKNEAKSARAVAARMALETVGQSDDATFLFLWANIHLIEPAYLTASAVELGRTTLARDPSRLTELLGTNGEPSDILELIVRELDTRELIAGLKAAPPLIGIALAVRPEIVGAADFWQSVEQIDLALQTAKDAGLQLVAMRGILESGRIDLARDVVLKFGAKIALGVLANGQELPSQLTIWVRAAANDVAGVAAFLAEQPSVPRPLLHALATDSLPDAVPNEYGIDPWLVAWRNSIGSLDEASTLYLMSYLFCRALGPRSKTRADLAQLSFESLYDAVATSRLPDQCWRLLESRLPAPLFWLTWDKCRRLLDGVIDLFVDNDLPPNSFAQLAGSDQLFIKLVETAAYTFRGRTYLRRVCAEIEGEQVSALDHRGYTIKKILDW